MRKQTGIEEVFNGISHGIGSALSVVGLSVLIQKALAFGDKCSLISFSIYGGSLIVLYLASTLYHSVPASALKDFLQIFDHSSIYVLIAGTYTPFCLITLRGIYGWTLFGVLWGLVGVGLALKLLWGKKSSLLYLAMGWLIIFAIKPLINTLSYGGFLWLLAGGLLYSIGVIFYALKQVKFAHVVWHLFVVAASICHFMAILLYVLPR